MTEQRLRSYSIGVLSLVLLVWAVAPAWDSFFTADDFLLVSVSVPQSGVDALRYFGTDWGGSASGGTYYRPLVNLSLWGNRVLTGLSPAALRVTSLALHIGVSALVALIAHRRLRLSAPGAVVSGSLFLLFPLHDQAIIWIAARTDLLCALFYGIGFLGLTSRSLPAQIAGSVAFALALAGKEMAVTLPIMATAWWMIFHGQERRFSFVRPLLLSAFVAAAYTVVRLNALGGIGGDPSLFILGRNVPRGFLLMLEWSLLPFDLERLRDFARGNNVLIVPLYALALYVLVVATRKARRDPAAWFGLLWIVMSASLVIARPNTWYAYIPSIGGCLALSTLLRGIRYERSFSFAILLIAGLGLRAGAHQMAEAGRLSEMLVRAGSHAGRDLYLVNSPIVLNERYGIVTDQIHFDSAAANLGLKFRTIALNYAYIEKPADTRLNAKWEGDAVVASADVGRRTYLTLDGTGVPNTSEIVGRPLHGTRALYQVMETNRGHIARIRIGSLPPEAMSHLAAFSAGRLVAIQ